MCGKMNNGDMLILFLITLFGAIICTYCIRRILLNARIADNPIVSEHRHKSGTPTMGGIAFLFVILLIIAIYYNNTPILIMSYIMLAGGIVGLLDDLIGLKVKEVQKIVVNTSDEVIALGRLDVIYKSPVSAFVQQESLGVEFEVADVPAVEQASCAIPWRKNDPRSEAICEKFSEATKAMIEDGTMKELSEKWLGMDLSVYEPLCDF